MNIAELRNLPAKTINVIIESHGANTLGCTPEQVAYILQLHRATELLRPDNREEGNDGSQLAAARLLRKDFPDISLRTARRRIGDAVTYMYADQNNTAEDWHLFYADKMEALGRRAESDGDMTTAMRCYSQAHDYRVLASEGKVDPERIQHKRILVSPDVQTSRMGLDDTGMRDLMQHAYRLIEQSSIPQREKERLRKETQLETGIEDAEFEDA